MSTGAQTRVQAATQAAASTERSQRSLVARLLASHGLNGFADGLWLTLFAIYLTEMRGIPARSMGLAIGLGGAVGLVGVMPLGAVADRRGPREVLGLLSVGRAVATAGFLVVDSPWRLAAVAALAALMQSAVAGVRIALTYKLIRGDRQMRVLAQSLVTQHIAYAGGAGIGGLVLAGDTAEGFSAAIALGVAAHLAAARVTFLLPHIEPANGARDRGITQAVTDLAFVAVVLSIAPLALCWAVLFTGLPLWTRSDTIAPSWTSAFAVVMSSVAIAALQVRFTGFARRMSSAVRAARWSGASFALCCLLFAAAAWADAPWTAFLVVTIGMGAHCVGELLYIAAGWRLWRGLMVKDAEGQYQGLVATVEAAVTAGGPAVATALVAGAGAGGWVAMAALFTVPVLPVGHLVQRAQRTRVGGSDPRTLVAARTPMTLQGPGSSSRNRAKASVER